MSEMASKMAVARKAIDEILDIEDTLKRKGADTATLGKAMLDVATLARIAKKGANDAVQVLKGIAVDIKAYMAEIEGATD